MNYITWLFLTSLFAYLVWRLDWTTVNAFRRQFFRGALKATIMILLLSALLMSVANLLMCFTEPYEYKQEVHVQTSVMDSIHVER